MVSRIMSITVTTPLVGMVIHDWNCSKCHQEYFRSMVAKANNGTPNNNLYKERSKTDSHNILPCKSNSCRHCSKSGGCRAEIISPTN